eukprot:2019206-Pleurochrysis_carterae.AAC.1
MEDCTCAWSTLSVKVSATRKAIWTSRERIWEHEAIMLRGGGKRQVKGLRWRDSCLYLAVGQVTWTQDLVEVRSEYVKDRVQH